MAGGNGLRIRWIDERVRADKKAGSRCRVTFDCTGGVTFDCTGEEGAALAIE
jgi:hypothetical protein